MRIALFAAVVALAGCGDTDHHLQLIEPVVDDPGVEAPGGDLPAPTPDAPVVDHSEMLRNQLGNSVWHGTVERDGVVRMVEQHFLAWDGRWSEVVNPMGPSLDREHRELGFDVDGATVYSTVTTPDGWGYDPDVGLEETYRLTVFDGTPRALQIEHDGVVETFHEGPGPAAAGGFTATARSFEPGGAVDTAFCDSGIWGFDYETLFAFARGNGHAPTQSDTVAGAPLSAWSDPGNNSFGIRDVPGFGFWGGTDVQESSHFIVTYQATLDHPGGPLRVRESDDTVEDGLWVFVDSQAGVGGEDDLLLEVHGFYWWDGTSNVGSIQLPPGPVNIEVIAARCGATIEHLQLEVGIDNGPWTPIDQVWTNPWMGDDQFASPF